jgi:hypothetical protein
MGRNNKNSICEIIKEILLDLFNFDQPSNSNIQYIYYEKLTHNLSSITDDKRGSYQTKKRVVLCN